jgi:hypothetical protein
MRKFFEDVRDAPAEVLDLKDELELFTFVSCDTEKLFRHASLVGILIESSTFTRTLRKCSNIVTDIGQKLGEMRRKLRLQSLGGHD